MDGDGDGCEARSETKPSAEPEPSPSRSPAKHEARARAEPGPTIDERECAEPGITLNFSVNNHNFNLTLKCHNVNHYLSVMVY